MNFLFEADNETEQTVNAGSNIFYGTLKEIKHGTEYIEYADDRTMDVDNLHTAAEDDADDISY